MNCCSFIKITVISVLNVVNISVCLNQNCKVNTQNIPFIRMRAASRTSFKKHSIVIFPKTPPRHGNASQTKWLSIGECCCCGRAKCFHKSLVVGRDGVQKHSSASRAVCVCVSSAVEMDRQDRLAGSSKSNGPKLCSD